MKVKENLPHDDNYAEFLLDEIKNLRAEIEALKKQLELKGE